MLYAYQNLSNLLHNSNDSFLLYNNQRIALSRVTGQLHSPNGDSDNSNGSQRAVAVTRSEVEQQQQQQQQPHRQRQQQRQATATVPVLACTNQSSITTTTTAFTVASSMLLLQTQVSNGLPALSRSSFSHANSLRDTFSRL